MTAATHGQFGSFFRWFLRGLAAGVLLMAAVNALSYFVRSSTWKSLVGARQTAEEAIGFPFQIWEGGNTYGGFFVDYPRLFLNMLVAILIGSVLGWVLASRRNRLNQILADGLASVADEHGHQESLPDQMVVSRPSPRPLQFSLFGLMTATTIAALGLMVASRFAARPETLVAIYVFGPVILVVIAMLPRHLIWQQRVKVIAPLAIALIAAAISVGMAIGMPFDQVLMGIFLCWTPQSALGALALTAWLFFNLSRRSESIACETG